MVNLNGRGPWFTNWTVHQGSPHPTSVHPSERTKGRGVAKNYVLLSLQKKAYIVFCGE